MPQSALVPRKLAFEHDTGTKLDNFIHSAQTFNILLDTGSADLWVLTTECTNCTQGVPRFNTSQSTTLKTSATNVSFSYGQGQAFGTLATDSVSLAGFAIGNQTFSTFVEFSFSFAN